MNANAGMANMNPMPGPMPGVPMAGMNNGAPNPAAAAAFVARQHQQQNNDQRGVLHTYIYEYFIRYGMYDCARAMLQSEQPLNVQKDGKGNGMNGVDESMDTDSKDGVDSKQPDDLPNPRLPMPASDSSFLYEWFCLFWDIFNAQRSKPANGNVNQYVAHTQAQSRLKQSQQQDLLRQMRPGGEMTPQQFQTQALMRGMANGSMNMNMKQGGNLARAAMANSQSNPSMPMMPQQGKQNPMQNPGMDPNRERPSSPTSGDGAPSPSKRPRIDGVPFNANQQPGPMMANGRPGQGMPGQQLGGAVAAHQMLAAHGINPNSLNPTQLQTFVQMPPPMQAKSIQAYSQNFHNHNNSQMGSKQMPNAGGPQGQGSPMMPTGQDLTMYYGGDLGASNVMRAAPNNVPNQGPAGNNHALQDYQMQLMLLEQQNKKRLMMARQEQDNGPVPGQTPGGPNGQQFADASPQAMRSGVSPNPSEQMKRGTPQMNNSGIPSPMPEGGQSRGSPNPAMNFMGGDPNNMNPQFFKGMEGGMGPQGQMNGMRPPSSHPQPFNGQLNPQQMLARQQQVGSAQWQQGQPGQQPPGPNGQVPQGQMQGTPRQHAMPPPSAPAAGANRTTASPQQAAAAPPTPNQGNKTVSKKKEPKKTKAAQKKANANAAATPAGDGDGEAPTPATPITPVNSNFNKNAPVSSAPPAATAQPAGAVPATDPMAGSLGMDFNSMGVNSGMDLEFAPITGNGNDVLSEFDFDSFLHDGETNEPFDLNGPSFMDGGEIGAD